MTYVGHGVPGAWGIDYSDVTPYRGVDISQIRSDAFARNAVINFNASCNTATSSPRGSVVDQLKAKIGPDGVVTGTRGATDFGTPPVDTDQELLDRSRSWEDSQKAV